MNVADSILATGSDEKAAIIDGRSTTTYRELRAKTNHIARQLLARGFQKGDRIVLVSENSAFFVATYLAIMRVGLVVVPLPAESNETLLSSICKITTAKAVILSNRVFRRAQYAIRSDTAETLVETQLEGANGFDLASDAAQVPIDPAQDLASIMFTSGSTGDPKGVMITHRNINCNTRDIIAYMSLGPMDRVFVVLPFHYCFGLSLLHTHLMAGATLVFGRQFVYPEQTVKDLLDSESTGLAGVPSTYQCLLTKSSFSETQFPNLRWFQVAGGKLEPRFQSHLLQLFPKVQLFIMYGQTEATARLSFLPPNCLPGKIGSIGKGLPSTRLDVLKPDGTAVRWGSDEVGEVVARGDNVALGYWNDPVESSKYFQNGCLRTGDTARVDSDGFIYLVGRERETIKTRGHRISPAEIESVIAELPAVSAVAVAPMPHELWGEAICAFVSPVAPDALTSEQIKSHCGRRLPPHKVPEKIIFRDQMPYTSVGKIAKQTLLKDANLLSL